MHIFNKYIKRLLSGESTQPIHMVTVEEPSGHEGHDDHDEHGDEEKDSMIGIKFGVMTMVLFAGMFVFFPYWSFISGKKLSDGTVLTNEEKKA